MLQAAFNYPAEQVKALYSLLPPTSTQHLCLAINWGAPSAPPRFPAEAAVPLAAIRPSPPPRLFPREEEGQAAVFHSTGKKSGCKGNFPPAPKQATVQRRTCACLGKHVLVPPRPAHAGSGAGNKSSVYKAAYAQRRARKSAAARSKTFFGCK